MNELFDRFLGLPMRQRVLLLSASILSIFFFYFSYFYWPLSSEISEKRDNVAMMQHDRDRKMQMVANLAAMREQVADLSAELKEATAQLPDSKEIPDLLSNISSLGRESGLDILVFRQRPEEYDDFYASVPVEIRVQGSYHQVGTFFSKVGHLDRIVNVNEISMKDPHIDGESVTINTSCTATTFRFLDEAERARIEKEREREKGGKK